MIWWVAGAVFLALGGLLIGVVLMMGLRRSAKPAVAANADTLPLTFSDRRRCSSCGEEISKDPRAAEIHTIVDMLLGVRVPVTLWVCHECQKLQTPGL